MARARLRLAQGRPGLALADLDECGHKLTRRQVLHPNHLPWQAWGVVALLRLGRDEEARARTATALACAREFGSSRAEGLALWATGLVERSPELLAEAVTVLAQVPAPLERARALVDLGAALRRANRRTEARAPLDEGLQIAHGCGADALVETATVEFAATGVHRRRPAFTGPDALTPAERRIAEQAAAGRLQPRHRPGPFHHPQDRRKPPGKCLPQARCGQPRRTQRRARDLGTSRLDGASAG